MLTINESMLKELASFKFPFAVEAEKSADGYRLLISCPDWHIDKQYLKTARGNTRVFKTFENLEKVCKSFGVSNIKVKV